MSTNICIVRETDAGRDMLSQKGAPPVQTTTCVFREGRKDQESRGNHPRARVGRGLENTIPLLLRVRSPRVSRREGQCSIRGFEKSSPVNLEEEHTFPAPGNLPEKPYENRKSCWMKGSGIRVQGSGLQLIELISSAGCVAESLLVVDSDVQEGGRLINS